MDEAVRLPTDIAATIATPHPAVISTVHPDGYPVTVRTWFLYEDDHIVLSIDAAGARGGRLDHLRANPNLCITVLPNDDWTSYISVQGHVLAIADDEDLVTIDRMSRHYTGHPYPRRRPRVCARVAIDSWHSHQPA